MDPTEAFVTLVAGPEADAQIDRGALLIAQHAYPDLDVDGQLDRLDRLAAGCQERSLAGVAARLVDDLGFGGNTRDYYDPRNSYLNDVLDRRVGLPITLSVLTIEVGRRLGLHLAGVGMPGHFLVREVGGTGFLDPFHGSTPLDEDDVRALFARLFGPDRRFAPAYLQPVGARSVLSRMLTNLVGAHLRRGEPMAAARAARLRLTIPGLTVEERAELAAVLAQLGHLDEAATVLDAAAGDARGQASLAMTASARKLRARRN